MDKYHIYEEIGKGGFSQVFKGREKKKIEYVAIKRIEKSVMQKIVSEVQIMHKLNSAHILKFYDWYETRNNLWLILEYCTGGDLESILNQDGHLPETSVRIFGLDILAGVKYLHTLGLIHCDLRPKNFLVDEYGVLKLSDFKLVQKIPTKILGESELPFEARGFPAYMAPEIFSAEGVHSYQSDFWSIGCMLYELRRGTPPFGDKESTVGELVEKIRNIEPVASPILFTGKDAAKKNREIPSISAELADMLQWLLEKAPMNRCTWVELSAHPFWGNNKPAPPTNLPPQHVFDALVRDLEKNRSQQLEMASNLEFGVVLNGRNPQSTTPLKLPISESTPIRPPPVSRQPVTQQHLQPEVEVPVIMSPSSKADEKIVIRADVRTANMESSAKIIGNIESKWPENKNDSKGLTRVPSEERIINLSYVEEKSVIVTTNYSSPQKHAIISDAPQAKESSRPTTGYNERKGSFLDDDKSVGMGSPSKQVKITSRSQPNDELGLITLLSHPTDTQVKPIVGNKAIEVIDKPGFSDEILSFDVIGLETVVKLNTNDLEYHLSQVHKSLLKCIQAAQSTTPSQAVLAALNERVAILGYLCSIAASQEVANVVLNTPFLGTILKLMKTVPPYSAASAITQQARANQASGTRPASNGIATLTSAVSTIATASRTLAATVLAMMLRHSTFIQPPTIRLREEHIVSSIVALLKEPLRMDPKFKRRSVAALGETIFYITAQEEDNSEGNDKWVLPNSAIDTIGRCLKDDADEIVRHYAAKTIENVFAQGGLEFKRRFTTFDIAVRLLELSQSSKSEVLQATCGMALSHMFLFIMMPNNLPPVTSFNGELSATSGKRSMSTTIAAPVVPDPFVHPIPVSSAKFIAKVLEKGGFAGILETLKDGQPKLQQAYLSILNTIFIAPINVEDYNKSVEDFSASVKKVKSARNREPEPVKQPETAASIQQAVNVALRITRNFFIKSGLMIPILIKLIDQGATSAVRGKAFIAAQLLCKQAPSSLAVLGERRLPSILVKLLEPILSQMATDGPGAPPVELSYVAKAGISMVNHIREVCEVSSAAIVDFLNAIVTTPNVEFGTKDDTTSTAGQSHKTPEPSPDKGAMKRRTPQSTAPLKHTPSAALLGVAKSTLDITKLRSSTEMLLSGISIASQPGIRKITLALDGQFVMNLSQALRLLPTVHATLAVQGTVQLELQDALENVEQALLVSLETLSQVDILDDGSSAGPPSLSSTHRNNLSPPPKNNANGNGGASNLYDALMSEEGWRLFVESFVTSLLPAVCVLINHHSGNVRAIVTNSLRRIIPNAVRVCLLRANQNDGSVLNQDVGVACIAQFISRMSTLLSDGPPIPTYAISTLADVMSISKGVKLTVIDELKRSGVATELINMLRENETKDNEEEEDHTINPQLVSLLKDLFEYQEGATLLLDCDIASALCSALLALTYSTNNLTNETVNEVIQMLIDLVYETLRFVCNSLDRANDTQTSSGLRGMSKAERQAQAEQYRRLVAPLRSITPALLLICARIDQFFDQVIHRRYDERNEGVKALTSSLNNMLDVTSMCLTMLFDLYQEHVTNQLLSRQSVMLDQNASTTTVTGYQDVFSGRMIFAKILGNVMMESKVKWKILKIVQAVCKLTINANYKSKAQDFLCQDPLLPVLQKIFKTYNSREAIGNPTENAAYAKLVLQTLDYANGL